jgi:hypothetical protein
MNSQLLYAPALVCKKIILSIGLQPNISFLLYLERYSNSEDARASRATLSTAGML